MVRCEYCEQRSEDTVNICPYCGAPLPVPDCSQGSGEMTGTDTEESGQEGSFTGTLIGSTIAAIGAVAASGNRRYVPEMRHAPAMQHYPGDRHPMGMGAGHRPPRHR